MLLDSLVLLCFPFFLLYFVYLYFPSIVLHLDLLLRCILFLYSEQIRFHLLLEHIFLLHFLLFLLLHCTILQNYILLLLYLVIQFLLQTILLLIHDSLEYEHMLFLLFVGFLNTILRNCILKFYLHKGFLHLLQTLLNIFFLHLVMFHIVCHM